MKERETSCIFSLKDSFVFRHGESSIVKRIFPKTYKRISETTEGGIEIENLQQIHIAEFTRSSELHPNENQDSTFVFKRDDKKAMTDGFGVFDGMGGLAKGEVASSMAATEAGSRLFEGSESKLTERIVENMVSFALHRANNEIYMENLGKRQKMGTTGTVGVIWDDKGEKKCTCGSVGDSRMLFYRGGKLTQLTLDDSYIRRDLGDSNEAYALQLKLSNATREGGLDERERYYIENRNIVTQWLGDRTVEPTVKTITIQDGDRLIVVSDGVSDNLTHYQIQEILGNYKNSEQAARELVGEAYMVGKGAYWRYNKRAKFDDMTAVVVQVGKDGERVKEEVHDQFSVEWIKKLLKEEPVSFKVKVKEDSIPTKEDIDDSLWMGEIDDKWRIMGFQDSYKVVEVVKFGENKTFHAWVKLDDLRKWNKVGESSL